MYVLLILNFLTQELEEKLKSFEYVLAKNAKQVYMRDLDHASKLHWLNQQKEALLQKEREILLQHALSVPDLYVASNPQDHHDDLLQDLEKREQNFKNFHTQPDHRRFHSDTENEIRGTHKFEKSTDSDSCPSHRFQRSVVRKSRFGGGTARILQNRQGNSNRSAAQRKIVSENGNQTHSSRFKRFGSLQNLKNYQNRLIDSTESLLKSQYFSGSASKTNSMFSLHSVESFGSLRSIPTESVEMQERRSLDSVELESRMNQYWQTSTTCF